LEEQLDLDIIEKALDTHAKKYDNIQKSKKETNLPNLSNNK